ncbi:Cytochrome P450 [Lentzea waywayandensis]|uniref:Cytochrome P450 n=1 Tax=Lentzea waywayandensis TaxID=84724 RepID=A0A1I6FJN3_9PSEU|nr:cytochrome P450 [Lentzea waywayandensis]SFR30163.1 Cytochrome P450 [Lentzea waywayandensis]
MSTPIPIHLRRFGFRLDPELERLREQEPMSRLTLPNGYRVWLVTNHRLVREVLANPETFGNNEQGWFDPANEGWAPTPAAGPDREYELHGNITEYNAPEHGRLRKLLAPAFSARRVKELRPLVEGIVDDCLESMISAGSPADLVKHFTLPIPSLTICELLGVPYRDRVEFERRGRDRLDTKLPRAVRLRALHESRQYMVDFIASERAQPGDGFIGRLVQEHGHEIDDHELVGAADILLLGGFETTAHMLALGTLLLLQTPHHWADVRNGENVDEIVEELLRHLSVVQTGMPRVAHRDVEIAGQLVRAGERILCSLPSANHDPEAFAQNADVFQPLRTNKSHLAFGHGIHYCLGASLARLEMRSSYQALARRLPSLRLAESPSSDQYLQSSNVFGLGSLMVEWEPEDRLRAS